MSEAVLTKEAVVRFLHEFEALAERESFDLVEDRVHERAFFRFNDGDFVGRPAVRGAFEDVEGRREGKEGALLPDRHPGPDRRLDERHGHVHLALGRPGGQQPVPHPGPRHARAEVSRGGADPDP